MARLIWICIFHLFTCICAQDKVYLITAPKILRLDASEKVLVQLFGYEQEEATVDLYLKRTLAPGDKRYAFQSLKLNAQNKYQAAATLRIMPSDFPKEEKYVYLQAISRGFTADKKIPVTTVNGFLFIQTDKPLYTPEQEVQVRVYSINEELRKSRRPVTLTFVDPNGIKVEMIDLTDINGAKPLLPPFKIPFKPTFGIWKIKATYAETFETTATAEFEVKEYVLPSISLRIEPEANYISNDNFESFQLKISAKYVHGTPVSEADVFLRFGYSSPEKTVMIPSTLRKYLMIDGQLDVSLNIKSALSSMPDEPQHLYDMMPNTFLRVIVLLQESSGGISEQAVLSNVKFAESPFNLRVVATPPFIKPGLPYAVRVMVTDPLGEPVKGVPITARATITNVNKQKEQLKFSGHQDALTEMSNRDGIAYFIYNVPDEVEKAEFNFETADDSWNQAQVTHNAESYVSVNHRYLYIDLPSESTEFTVGQYTNIKVYFNYREYLSLKTFRYQVISRGKVVKFDRVERVNEKSQNLNIQITPEMVPSARLLVYYILTGEGKAELVADSVWIDVKAKCINNLNVDLSTPNSQHYNPKDKIQLRVSTKNNKEESLIALSAVDTALYNLRSDDKDPLRKVLQHIEQSDLGCGRGAGKNNADVFDRAGLTIITNANAEISSEGVVCTSAARPRRSVDLSIALEEHANKYGAFKQCCKAGASSSPTLETCRDRAERLNADKRCKNAFYNCCEFALKFRKENEDQIILSRSELDFTSRRRRSVDQSNTLEEHANKYGAFKQCCKAGASSSPTLETCRDRAERLNADKRCKNAFYNCCEFELKLRKENEDQIILSRSELDFTSRRRRSVDQSNTLEEHANKYGAFKQCCKAGASSSPTLETCRDRAERLNADKRCKNAFYNCCEFELKLRKENEDQIILSRSELDFTSRRRRSVDQSNTLEEHANKYGAFKQCCKAGASSSPTLETCRDRAERLNADKRCKSAFYNCCEFELKLRKENEDQIILSRSELDFTSRRRRSVDQSNTLEEHANKFGPFKQCCKTGANSSPTLETCKQRAARLKAENRCKNAFYNCCEFALKLHIENEDQIILSRSAIDFLLDSAPAIRSYFPESWLWEEQTMSRSGSVSISKHLPDSLTTWELKAVGVFSEGVCMSDPAKVYVSQEVSVDIPLPYSMVRGEQIELKGSVYNQHSSSTGFSVTLTAPKGVCLFRGVQRGRHGKPHENKGKINAHSVALVKFYIMALEAGTHTLTFTLKTERGNEILIKKLRVVPEGVRTEIETGGRIDPRGVFGTPLHKLVLKNSIPPKIVPKSTVQRSLIINGEVLGELLSIINDPRGLKQLTTLPRGSAEMELMGLLPIYYVYHFLESTEQWDILGKEASASNMELKRKMKDGITSIMSFKLKREYAFSMWSNKDKSASTWVTALVVKTLADMHKYVPVESNVLGNTISWLTRQCQNRDGSFTEKSETKPFKLMGAGAEVTEQSVFLTSFVMIGIKKAMLIKTLSLEEYKIALIRAAEYVSSQTKKLENLYVKAIASYALTLVDIHSMPAVKLYEGLKKQAQIKGNPATVRFWEDAQPSKDPLKPSKTTAKSVETTAYILLNALERGDSTYAKPILNWLTQDQRYGGGVLSTQDTILTLEALSRYSLLAKQAVLDMSIIVEYKTKGDISSIKLTQQKPMAKPIEVNQNDDIILKTAMTSGVSFAKLRTVYYQMSESNENCNFDISIDIHERDPNSNDPMLLSQRIVACAKYKLHENSVEREAGLTVMEINLPTGVSPVQEDLDMYQNGLESLFSNYEIRGDQVILQIDSIPSDEFYCVGFRIHEEFETGLTGASAFRVYEFHAPDDQCMKYYYQQSRRLLRLCEGDECQCMAAECCNYKSTIDSSITTEQRRNDVCQDSIKYAFKVVIESSEAVGDFVTYKAKVETVLKKEQADDIKKDSEIEFVKRATCSSTNFDVGKQYLIMTAERIQIQVGHTYKYKFPLDSQAWVEWWPRNSDTCSDAACGQYITVLDNFEFDFLLDGC